MKKNQVISSIVILSISLLALLSIVLNQGKYNGSGINIILGFLVGVVINSTINIFKYIYWNKNEERKKLNERKLRREKIDLKDERKTMIRDKSGREAYLLGIIVVGISIIVFMFLKAFKIYDVDESLLIYLIIYIFFQYILEIVLYRYFEKRF